MKKIRVIAMILLVGTVFLAGCGGKSKYLKPVQTDLSASDFYNTSAQIQYVELMDGSQEVASPNLTEEQSNYLVSFMLPETLSGALEICVVSAMDFCMQIVDNNSNDLQKIYEYGNQIEKEFVVVNKNKGQNLFNVQHYEASRNVSVSDVLGRESTATYSFEIKTNKNTNKYSFVDKTTNATGSFYFSQESGILNITYSFQAELIEMPIQIEKSIYGYKNGVYAQRTLSKVGVGEESVTYVNESLFKSFYYRNKTGIVKDASLAIDLTKILEDDIAQPNESDSYGIKIIGDMQSGANSDAVDRISPNVEASTYGIFPSEQ